MLALLLVPGLVSASAPAYPMAANSPEITDALDYLRGTQEGDGSIGGFVTSAWVTMAIGAAGEDPHDWKTPPAGPSIVDYLRDNYNQIESGKATDWERSILAIVAACEDPYDFGGIDYVTGLKDLYDGSQIGYNSTVNDDFWGVIALIAAGESPESEIIQNSVSFILDNQLGDGGWSLNTKDFYPISDVDNTAAAIMALIAAGVSASNTSVQSGLDYIAANQDPAGGFGSGWGPANSQSTSWAICAIMAAGQNPTSEDWTTESDNNPVDYLLSLQDETDGFFYYAAGDSRSPQWETAYAIPALLGIPHPIIPEYPSEPTPSASPTASPSATHTAVPTSTPTLTVAANPSPTPSHTASPTATTTPTSSPTSTATPTATSIPPLTGEGQIGSTGGTASTSDGRITVTFPPGAVPDDTSVNIEPVSCTSSPGGFRLGATCFSITAAGGGGQVHDFSGDVIICVAYTAEDVDACGGDPQLLQLAYYDEAANEWVALDSTVDEEASMVCASTSHLSRWALVASGPGTSIPWWIWVMSGCLLISLILVIFLIYHKLYPHRSTARVNVNPKNEKSIKGRYYHEME